MKRLLREPLVHFVVLGAALYALLTLAGREDAEPRERSVVVTEGKIEHLAALFARTFQRPPSREELERLVDDYVREELAYREGLAMGLDGDDPVIRRRVRQKLDFLAEDLAAQDEPGDEELAAYLAAQPEAFRLAPRLSFRQVRFDPARRGAALARDVEDALARLERDPSLDVATLGDPTLLEPAWARVSAGEIASVFGERFAASVAALEPGAWRGPVESAYGLHLVRVDERVEGGVPALEEVRAAVRREWESARRAEMLERFYAELRTRYEVEVRWPAGALADGDG